MTAESTLEVKPGPDGFSEVPFYISARGQATRTRHTLKQGDTFVVLDSHGDIGASAGGEDGLFHCDTRYLSYLEVVLDGLQPLLLGSNLRDDNSMLTVELTNPDVFTDGHISLLKDTVHVARNTFIWQDTAYQRLNLRNYSDAEVTLRATVYFGSDFADIFEVRGSRRTQRGVISRRVAAADQVMLTYIGRDGRVRRTTVMFDPAPTEINVNSASYTITLPPRKETAIFLTVGCDQAPDARPGRFLRGFLSARRELRAPTGSSATVETSNAIFNEVLCRSMADLSMLMTDTAQGRYPYAGIPWYSTTFGRDGLITAMQLLWADPKVAKGVLRRLTHYQAREVDAASDAQPGKILHEMRGGEMAALGEVPFAQYYGSVDSTPLFIVLLGRYIERTGDLQTLAELWPAAEAALRWIDQYGDPDGDGFIEYQRATDEGLANQGWKDSHDSNFHADGRLAVGPMALAEVQGYVYEAKRRAAYCARLLNHFDRASELEAQAEQLAARFEEVFWLPELKTYALALDGKKEPCAVRSSNAGHLMFSGVIRPDRAAIVADEMLRPRMFSGWGIRTIAKGESRYNPMSYHNGSIWPHDNALIALGLARYGAMDAVERVFKSLVDAAAYMELRRLPELFCGFTRKQGRGPTLYPVACAPQAWASATPFSLLEASLGFEFNPQAGEIRLRNPRLPAFLDDVTIRDVTLGNASVDFAVHRHGTEVSLQILRCEGDVRVSVVFTQKPNIISARREMGAFIR
jgi:glycogen debranching enzyme